MICKFSIVKTTKFTIITQQFVQILAENHRLQSAYENHLITKLVLVSCDFVQVVNLSP